MAEEANAEDDELLESSEAATSTASLGILGKVCSFIVDAVNLANNQGQ